MGNTWRSDPFKPGATYRVRKTFKPPMDLPFVEGDLMKYESNAYSAYHSMTGFSFKDDKGKSRCWDIHDDDSLEIWSELFEQIP
jgi:hypothetical protein